MGISSGPSSQNAGVCIFIFATEYLWRAKWMFVSGTWRVFALAWIRTLDVSSNDISEQTTSMVKKRQGAVYASIGVGAAMQLLLSSREKSINLPATRQMSVIPPLQEVLVFTPLLLHLLALPGGLVASLRRDNDLRIPIPAKSFLAILRGQKTPTRCFPYSKSYLQSLYPS